MKKSFVFASLALSLGLTSAVASAAPTVNESYSINRDHTTDAAINNVSVATAANNPVNRIYRQTKPIFYGTDGIYPFSSAVRVGNTLYLSGQMGLKNGKLVQGGVKAQTKQALTNINNTLLQYGYQKSDLVKCMVMLTDMNDFADFNDVYKTELTKPYPVRSAFAVANLALGGSVEIECMAVK